MGLDYTTQIISQQQQSITTISIYFFSIIASTINRSILPFMLQELVLTIFLFSSLKMDHRSHFPFSHRQAFKLHFMHLFLGDLQLGLSYSFHQVYYCSLLCYYHSNYFFIIFDHLILLHMVDLMLFVLSKVHVRILMVISRISILF